MKRMIVISVILLQSFMASAQILHVPADHTTIQEAIDASSDGDTILVAEGTYYENINFRGKAITVGSKFIINGDEAHIARTVIDGSFPENPDSASVVTIISCDSSSILNGLTITGGKGTVSKGNPNMLIGGGILCEGGASILNNVIMENSCIIQNGYPGGGGIFAYDLSGKSMFIRGNTIYRNMIRSGSTFAQGGGLFIGRNEGLSVVEDNHIIENQAICTGTYKANGGGVMIGIIRMDDATILVRNNRIADNEIHCKNSHGGAIFLTFMTVAEGFDPRNARIEIYNNLITGNYSEHMGGAIAVWDQENGVINKEFPIPFIYNNTIVDNTAAIGAGFFNFKMRPLLFNNIIRNNVSGNIQELSLDRLPTYKVINTGEYIAQFNNIQQGYPGAGNIDMDPLINETDYSLNAISPSIGRGIDSIRICDTWIHAPEYDYRGVIRIYASADHETDQGAMESPYDRQVVHYDSDRVINVPSEQPTIQAAINAASEGDTVLVEEGVYFENINFRGKAITVGSKFIINGDKAHIAQTVIDGSQALRADSASVVTFNSGEDTTSVLKGLTLTGGGGTKAIVNLGENVDFCGGGGIYMGESGGKIEDNIITGNRIERPDHRLTAGGIWADGGEADRIIRNNSICLNELNSTIHAMGAGMLLFSRNGNTIIEGNSVFGNIANAGAGSWAGGGGIMIPSDKPWGGSFIMRNNMITENQAHGTGTTGGGLYFEYLPFSESYQAERSSVEIYNNVIAENVSDHFGGGIGIDDDNNLMDNWVHASPVIYNNTIVNNRSSREAGFYNRGAKPLLYNNIFWNESSFVPKGEEFLKNTLFVTYNNSIRSGWDPHWDMCAEPEFYEGTYQLTDGNICLGRGTASVEVNGEAYYAPSSDMFGQKRITEEKTRIDPGAVWSQSAMTDAFNFVETLKGGEGSCEYTLDMKLAGGVPPYTIYLDGEEQASVPIENVCQGPHIVEVKDAEDNAITWEVELGVGLNEALAEETISVLYPNPTNGITRLNFTLEKPVPVCITLFNMLGQQERVVLQEEMLPGRHVAVFDVSDLEPGLFFIKLEGAAVSTHKLIVE